MKFQHGTRKLVYHGRAIDMRTSLCRNGDTALRFELSSHRGGFLLGGAM